MYIFIVRRKDLGNIMECFIFFILFRVGMIICVFEIISKVCYWLKFLICVSLVDNLICVLV